MRPGRGPVEQLRPVSADAARRNSLSAKFGLGSQPLHTDGAHLADPPQVIAIGAETAGATATRLFSTRGGRPPWDALRHGVFRVSTGRDSFHVLAFDGRRVRFDPGCMTPCDQRAREVAEYFKSALADATRHKWTSDGDQVLVIDNRRTLHAREAVDPSDGDRTLLRVAFWLPEEQ